MKDPIVEEVRRIRHEHEQQCGFDLNVILADIRRHQRRYPLAMVRLKPRRIAANKRLQRTEVERDCGKVGTAVNI